MEVSLAGMVKDLILAIGEGKVDNTMPTRVAYRGAHSAQILLHDLDYFTPGVVVWPESVEDVQKVVRIGNEWKVPIIPQGGRTATSGSEGVKDAISVDLCRMHKILHFDEELSLAWYRIVGSGDGRHLKAGTSVEPLGNRHAAES